MTRMINALNKKRDGINSNDKGFTLIELLVVVIIIGILAAIAIPVYIGVQNSAKDSSAQSDLANAKIAVVAYYTSQNAFPSAIDSATLGTYGYAGTSVVNASSSTATINAFCLRATGGNGALFYVTQATAPAVGATAPTGCSAT